MNGQQDPQSGQAQPISQNPQKSMPNQMSAEKPAGPQPPRNQEKKDSKKKQMFLIFLIILLMLFFIFLILWLSGYLERMGDRNNAAESSSSTSSASSASSISASASSSSEEAMVVPISYQGKIFYHDFYNLYMADQDGTNQIALTEFAENTGKYFISIHLVDDTTLAFGVGGSEPGDSFQIYTYDFTTEELELVREHSLDSLEYVNIIGWNDIDTYVYQKSGVNDPSGQVKIVRVVSGVETAIVTIDAAIVGREGVSGDTSRIHFSPDGTHFLYINTAATTGTVFNGQVYVYDLDGSLITTIENATFPLWKNDDEIIFVKYNDGALNALAEMDIGAGTVTDIDTNGDTITSLVFHNQKIAYATTENNVDTTSIYDYETSSTTASLVNYDNPVWLSDNELVVTKTKECTENCTAIIGQPILTVNDGYFVYNTESDVYEEITFDDDNYRGIFMTWLWPYL